MIGPYKLLGTGYVHEQNQLVNCQLVNCFGPSNWHGFNEYDSESRAQNYGANDQYAFKTWYVVSVATSHLWHISIFVTQEASPMCGHLVSLAGLVFVGSCTENCNITIVQRAQQGSTNLIYSTWLNVVVLQMSLPCFCAPTIFLSF